MGRASKSRARSSTSFEKSSPGGPKPRPFQKKSSTSRARASLTSLIWVNFKIISYQNYAIQKWIVLFSKISQEFQVLNGIRNHKMVSKYFFKKISNTFGLNIANLSSFYDRLLCPGPLPGTLLFWPWAGASRALALPKKVEPGQPKKSRARAEPEPSLRLDPSLAKSILTYFSYSVARSGVLSPKWCFGTPLWCGNFGSGVLIEKGDFSILTC